MIGESLSGVHVFGIRHLSPGGAKHLLDYLNEVRPTAVLIEGPADATAEIRHLTNWRTKPPVALLAFTDKLPVRTVLWPFASYSAEYQAMKWAAANGAYAAFIDLPASVTLALQGIRERDADSGRNEEEGERIGNDQDEPPSSSHAAAGEEYNKQSIYEAIAGLAGESDYEMYWERHYEHNLMPGAYQAGIAAFSKLMRELSEERERVEARSEYAYNAVREAYMRRQIHDAIASGHEPGRIVVVCGAYHKSALSDLSDAMTDDELAALPSRSAKLTLMPYSYYKLSSMSGYGAGNVAPHYYEMMWERMQNNSLSDLPHHYLSSAARLMRESGTHRSTAEVIEAVRMAESLAALHDGNAPSLRDLRDAAVTLLGRGELSAIAEPLARIEVGTAIGELAEGVSQTPIQDDLNRYLAKLKLTKYKTTAASDLLLDLRENRRSASEESAWLDLNRSFLFHRLRLLSIAFAVLRSVGQASGSWKEHWVLQWSPEAEIQVVESTLLGETIEVAAGYTLQQKLNGCRTIAEAAGLIRIACDCGMVTQMEAALQVLQQLAVDTRDVIGIASASRELSAIIQYGDIRRIDTAPLEPLLEQLFWRACQFLIEASQCNDEAADGMLTAMNILNGISSEHSGLVDEPLWLQQLHTLSERDDLHPRLSGFACAILIERGAIGADATAAEVARRLSPGVPADLGAGWFDGLSRRNRYALLSRLSLWEQLNEYIASLDDEQFARALVFLRRAFSSFSPREKTMVAEALGEIWGVNTEQAAEILTGELKEDEAKMIDELNDFDFGDL